MSRRIASADFIVSAVSARDFPTDGRPEIAMVGRSNVGKSTLINALLRKAIARTSASPGKTRQVNVYRVTPVGGGPFYLMDLPGYGHAGGGPKAQAEFAGILAEYFGTALGRPRGKEGAVRPAIAAAVLAVDARHPGMASDAEACRWLQSLGIPIALVATKADKLSQSERSTLRRECERAFGQPPLAVSAVKGDGLDELWTLIAEWTT